MTDPILVNNPYEGSTKVNCREAVALLNSGVARKAWFRPDGFVDYNDPDKDVAFVWFEE